MHVVWTQGNSGSGYLSKILGMLTYDKTVAVEMLQ